MKIKAAPFSNSSGSIKLEVNEFDRSSDLIHIAQNSSMFPAVFGKHGNLFRLVEIDGETVLLEIDEKANVNWYSDQNCVTIGLVKSEIKNIIHCFQLKPSNVAHLPEYLRTLLLSQSPLLHIGSPTLVEAIVKAVIRQVIASRQAKLLIHKFTELFGTRYKFHDTTVYRFPNAHDVVDLTETRLRDCGLGYKAKIIPSIVRELLLRNLDVLSRTLKPHELVELLQQIRGVGDWTARIAVCDFLGDWSVYPFGDLAVRKWAQLFWPTEAWSNNPHAFYAQWLSCNKDSVGQVTFCLLSTAPYLDAGGKNDLRNR